jgi:hypothetical protein
MDHPPRATLRGAALRALLTLVVVQAAVIASARPSSAATCSAAAFSCPGSGTCIITGTWNIGSGCLLDFGAGAVEIRGTLQADVRSGSFEVRAGTLTLNAGKLKSLGDADEPGGSITALVTGAFVMRGSGPRIDTSGNGGGGGITVTASSVDLQTGVVTADGGGDENCGDGGVVVFEATGGSLASAVTVRAGAGSFCGGGLIGLTGTSVSVSGDVDAHGGAYASDEAISLTATAGNVTVSGTAALSASGTGQSDGYGSDGGQITISAPAGAINLGGSSVSASGKSPYGSGGAVGLYASGNIAISSHLNLPAGSNGFGGEVVAEAGGSLSVTEDINVTGGDSSPYGQGGDVDFYSTGPATVAATIDATALIGGDVGVESESTVTVSGHVTARGSRLDGGGVALAGCGVTVSGTLDAGASNGGPAGDIDIEARTVTLTSVSSVQATPCIEGSCIALTTATGSATIQSGASVAPTPTQIAAPGLPSCP